MTADREQMQAKQIEALITGDHHRATQIDELYDRVEALEARLRAVLDGEQ